MSILYEYPNNYFKFMLQSKYILNVFAVLFFCFLFACNKDKDKEKGEDGDGDIELIGHPKAPPKKGKFSSVDFEILDQNGNELFEVGEELVFNIRMALGNTQSKNFEWQFGDGKTGIGRNPIHIYEEIGRYLVTLKLNKEIAVEKIIDIQKLNKPQAMDSIVQIYGPKEGIVGQELVFRAHGTGVSDWIWEFGDPPGLISSEAEAQVVHKYEESGEYLIKVTSNLSKYPVIHKIVIFPVFEPLEEVDLFALYGEDIRVHLQKIADAPNSDFLTFDREKRYILDKYICNVDNVVMVINGSRYKDFISYCLGIHHLYSKDNESLLIEEVIIDTIACVQKMEVTETPKSPMGL